MDICHLYDYAHQAGIGAREYARDNCENIKRVMLQPNFNRIWTEDGNIHYFMGGYKYFQWSKGRTYMLSDGTMMHSGYPLKK